MDIAWFRSDLGGCGCRGEAPFKSPGGLWVSSCVGAVLFCGVNLNDLGLQLHQDKSSFSTPNFLSII